MLRKNYVMTKELCNLHAEAEAEVYFSIAFLDDVQPVSTVLYIEIT